MSCILYTYRECFSGYTFERSLDNTKSLHAWLQRQPLNNKLLVLRKSEVIHTPKSFSDEHSATSVERLQMSDKV